MKCYLTLKSVHGCGSVYTQLNQLIDELQMFTTITESDLVLEEFFKFCHLTYIPLPYFPFLAFLVLFFLFCFCLFFSPEILRLNYTYLNDWEHESGLESIRRNVANFSHCVPSDRSVQRWARPALMGGLGKRNLAQSNICQHNGSKCPLVFLCQLVIIWL